MKQLCSIYKSDKIQELYLYVLKAQGPHTAPKALLEQMGKLTKVMDMLLTPEKKLARADINKVQQALITQGFYLQMPPVKEEYLEKWPEEWLRFNDPT